MIILSAGVTIWNLRREAIFASTPELEDLELASTDSPLFNSKAPIICDHPSLDLDRLHNRCFGVFARCSMAARAGPPVCRDADPLIFTPGGLRHLIAEVGVSQIVLGTDYPFPWR
jgi:hypothetical protein